jgi:hypothetical protein
VEGGRRKAELKNDGIMGERAISQERRTQAVCIEATAMTVSVYDAACQPGARAACWVALPQP